MSAFLIMDFPKKIKKIFIAITRKGCQTVSQARFLTLIAFSMNQEP